MKFAELYLSNLKAVKDTLTAMWCSEARGDAQKAYAEQLKTLIDEKLFTSDSIYPVVQSMETYKTTEGPEYDAAMSLIGKDLWGKTKGGSKGFHPYIHQYDCWKSLLGPNKESIVVTTGTGSGKTECFMLPLVRDLIDNKLPNEHKIQAIFLYPLNALMEDQKSRMQDILAGTDLTFAVYNGNLPECEDDDNSVDIADEQAKYDRIIPTRVQLHQTPPDILLTNPTMLEYMLLRDKDQKLFTKGSLKWIVVDEAHTFTGAGASELAFLLRRVVNAFGVNPDTDLRFAASSATIGKGKDDDLKQFISDISGIPFNKVNVISGDRPSIPNGLEPDVFACRSMLRTHDFVKLDELIPGGKTVEEKLEILDTLCDRGVRAKVHFFYRVANNGIRVQLDTWADRSKGILKLMDLSPESIDATPALELKRCKHCGEYVATAEMSSVDDTYRACANESTDIFSMMTPAPQHQLRVFGVVDRTINSNNQFLQINGNHCSVDNNPKEQWCVVANDLLTCPHCGASLINGNDDDEDEGVSNNVSERELKLDSLRISDEFISQILAPSILSQVNESKTPAQDPHRGQQYISFVDSRQSAAQSTFKQNLEVEKSWVYSRIFHKLCEDQSSKEELRNKIEEYKSKRKQFDEDSPEYDSITEEIISLRKKINKPFAFLTWDEIFTYLTDECKAESDSICKQFVNKESDEEINGGTVNDAVKERYIFSVMLEQLSKYPPHSATAETMGLLESYYPSLSKAVTPDAFKKYNALCGNPIADNKLDDEWKNLLKIYIDRVARSNEFIFMRMDNHLDSDIFNCSSRFGLKKPSRRVARLPLVTSVEGKLPIIHILLAKMLGARGSDMRDQLKKHKDIINEVIEAMWNSLVNETQLLQYSSRIASRDKIYKLGTVKASGWREDKDSERDRAWLQDRYDDQDILDKILDPAGRQLRFNVAELAFRLPQTVHFCSVFEARKKHIRPATNLFCGHSAYYDGDDVSDPIESQTWDTIYPYIKGVDTDKISPVSEAKIQDWAELHRSGMFKYGLMDGNGCFRNKILQCLEYPEVYLQAEHTAQVDKAVSKASQILFQNHKINILACSTTMEMGVDLGDLDLVMMSSIPPHPANYKQRAGRSGRNTGNRSACITLCTSDIVGMRILKDPISTLISRPVSMPFVDNDCPTIIQRHANAFLFRESKKFVNNNSRSNLSLDIVNCFSNYYFHKETKYTKTGRPITVTNYWDLRDQNDKELFPNFADPMGPEDGTRFEAFRNWLINDADPSSLDFLLCGTSMEGKNEQIISECKEMWEARRDELVKDLAQIGEDYEEAYNEVKTNPDVTKSSKAHASGQLDTPYGNKLRWEYYHVLRKNLIEYLATHRFTPNANMPVDVVEFNVNGARVRNSSPWKKQPNNPSYQLRQALSQYAPGNSVVKENRVLKVAGIDFIGKNRNEDKDPLITFYTNGSDVVMDTMKSRIASNDLKIWPTSNKQELQLVRAKSFIPDINEEDSRLLDTAPYTHVNAQLVGANKWDIAPGYTHLAALRSSSHSGNAKILYYNDGIGFGYCLCGRCGKMVLESGPARGYANLPEEMTCIPLPTKNQTTLHGHYAIDRQSDDGKSRWCSPNNNKYFRNVILGDLIQTDYCEIKIREQGDPNWIASRQTSTTPLLTTLGILICKVYTELIGKDRLSVDFLLMPAGSLCIFDTNPGGSGYSNKLADPYMFRKVVSGIDVFLSTISSKDALLDKFTLHYLNDIDIERTTSWIKAEIDSWKDVPAKIKATGLDARWATLANIVNSIDNPTVKCSLFVNDIWESWNFKIDNQYYDDESDTWKLRIDQLRRAATNHSIPVNVITFSSGTVNLPPRLYDVAIEMKGWLNGGNFQSCTNILPQGLFPLAIIGDKLFFTDDIANSALNSLWAKGNVFEIDKNAVNNFTYKDVDLTHRPGTHAEFKLPMDEAYVLNGKPANLVHIHSNELFNIISAFSSIKNVDLNGFLKSVSLSKDRLELSYQDEHMKSGAGILVALQFIKDIIITSGKQRNFSLKFLNEEYFDFKGTESYPFSGMKDHDTRNAVIKNLTDQLYEELDTDMKTCPFINDTRPYDGLTHWRVLIIKCGDKQLSIYPNGGFINEWKFDKKASIETYEDNDKLLISNKIALYRRKEIKYEVIIDNQ